MRTTASFALTYCFIVTFGDHYDQKSLDLLLVSELE
jgi:hypothetical protein